MRKTKALVVEGGAMRGIFASGVLDAFMEKEYYPYDFVMGVSAGASNLVGYLSRTPKRSYSVITELATSRSFYDPKRFLAGGHLLDIRWLIDESNRLYPIEQESVFSSVPFFAVATNLKTGNAEYYRVTKTNFEKAIEATSALPLVYRSTPCFSGGCFTDGGIADSIPVQEAYRRGARDITVILSQPLEYRMKPTKSEWMMKRLFSRYPEVANTIIHRAEKYNRSLHFIQNPPSDLNIQVIAPPASFAVRRLTMNRQRLEEGYRMGIEAGYTYLEKGSTELEYTIQYPLVSNQ